MSAIACNEPGRVVPIPRCSVAVRPAAMSDYPFIDRLQDMHSKALGFMPRAQLEGKIKLGHVLIAEEIRHRGTEAGRRGGSEEAEGKSEFTDGSSLVPHSVPSCLGASVPVGYCMSQDRYFKRDDVGIIYQMNVLPVAQRKLVGATLLRAVFARAAYGCRLFCCWCAQDLDANYFWESLGFVPLAFRAGASGRSARGRLRTHIFWQRRIREGDTTTPYWFPAKTDGGMMREDRLVLPIPPGVHWKDPMPILIPEAPKPLPEPSGAPAVGNSPAVANSPKPRKVPTLMPPTRRRVQFGAVPIAPAPKTKPAKPKREKVKADPALVAKARELRDRWLEKVNDAGGASLLSGGDRGKYAVGRTSDFGQLSRVASSVEPELAAPPTQAPQLLLPAA